MVISLIGYRGSGKTAVARPLAAALGWEWIDADARVEERAGKTIRQIFSDDGEPAFRALERQVLAELLQRDKVVIATGGGAILNPQSRIELPAAGPVIWLQATPQVLAARIAADASTADRRPALAGGGADEVSRLLALREPWYRECASFRVETDHASISEIVAQILPHVAAWQPHPKGGST